MSIQVKTIYVLNILVYFEIYFKESFNEIVKLILTYL